MKKRGTAVGNTILNKKICKNFFNIFARILKLLLMKTSLRRLKMKKVKDQRHTALFILIQKFIDIPWLILMPAPKPANGAFYFNVKKIN